MCGLGSLSRRRDSEFYCLFPFLCAISEGEWCNDDGIGWFTQGGVWCEVYFSIRHSLCSLLWNKDTARLLCTEHLREEHLSFFSFMLKCPHWERQAVSEPMHCLWGWTPVLFSSDSESQALLPICGFPGGTDRGKSLRFPWTLRFLWSLLLF